VPTKSLLRRKTKRRNTMFGLFKEKTKEQEAQHIAKKVSAHLQDSSEAYWFLLEELDAAQHSDLEEVKKIMRSIGIPHREYNGAMGSEIEEIAKPQDIMNRYGLDMMRERGIPEAAVIRALASYEIAKKCGVIDKIKQQQAIQASNDEDMRRMQRELEDRMPPEWKAAKKEYEDLMDEFQRIAKDKGISVSMIGSMPLNSENLNYTFRVFTDDGEKINQDALDWIKRQ